VFAISVQGHEVRECVGREFDVNARTHKVDLFIGAHISVDVVVVLVETDAGAHVEKMLRGHPVEGPSTEFGHEIRDGCVDIEQVAFDEAASDCCGDGLRHRHQYVR
jgi:hypothetical protein